MQVPTEAVNTLSDTAWGAILILTVFVMGSFLTYLMLQVRTLNRELVKVADKRTEDARSMYEQAQALARESLTVVEKATHTTEGLGYKINEVTRALSCRECPARARFGGEGG